MNSFKCYNSYIGLKMRCLMYVGYPLFVGAFAVFQLIFLHAKWMIPGTFIMTMVFTLTLIFFMDKYSIGAIYINKGQDDEMIKSSSKGAEFIKKVLTLDLIFRFAIILTITLIIVAVTVIAGYFDEYKLKILSSSVIFLLAMDGVSNLAVVICRMTRGHNEAVATFFGLEMLYVPAVAVILIGEPVGCYITSLLYLILDVSAIMMNIKKTNKLVNEEWYKD